MMITPFAFNDSVFLGTCDLTGSFVHQETLMVFDTMRNIHETMCDTLRRMMTQRNSLQKATPYSSDFGCTHLHLQTGDVDRCIRIQAFRTYGDNILIQATMEEETNTQEVNTYNTLAYHSIDEFYYSFDTLCAYLIHSS